jgi:hypothetical protein
MPHPAEFRRRAVELARLKAKPVAEIARDQREPPSELDEPCRRRRGPQGGPVLRGTR